MGNFEIVNLKSEHILFLPTYLVRVMTVRTVLLPKGGVFLNMQRFF